MRKSIVIFFILFPSAFFIACGGPDISGLPGNWQAVAWTDAELMEQEPLDGAEMDIQFFSNKRYAAQLQGGQPEAGRYTSMRNNLFVTDTTVQNPTERAVQVARLTADSLYLRFGKSGSHSVMVLVRK
ncbi:MAG: hypothetical protein ABIV51_00085 [Saprospiraceae bacterium]